MKQFQKYGVAAAVASLASGAVAQMVSPTESGDLAIIPYYTTLDGKNTGMHIINTTDNTQVLKVRLRRGADSKDALDFNVVLSPRDEWTANIGAGGDTGVQVTTNDNSCTVPEFPDGVAQMPDTYAEGAAEGYVEIIAMAQPTTELAHLPILATHVDGVPISCDILRDNFFRVGLADITDGDVRGVHAADVVSTGFCTAVNAPLTALCPAGTATNLTFMEDSDDNALKVSYFITDSTGGLEAGDNAVMVSGFASAPMMTNQQPLSFGTAGILQYDPLNFELPNLSHGGYASSDAFRQGAPGYAGNIDGSMFDGVRSALDAEALINDWAAFETSDGSVAADWVVTLPGQYALNNPTCDLYNAYTLAATGCSATALATDTTLDQDELPLVLASNTTNNPISGNSNLSLWDREEGALNPPDAPDDQDLGFSPGGSAGDPTQLATLNREVNVIMWKDGNVLGTADLQDEDLGLGVIVNIDDDADRGWAELTIAPATAAGGTWSPNCEGLMDGGNAVPMPGICAGEAATDVVLGSNTPVANDWQTAVVGFAVWERNFADQAGNYGRIVEHSTISSARNP